MKPVVSRGQPSLNTAAWSPCPAMLRLRLWFWLPLLFTASCGSKEPSRALGSLDVTRLSVTAGFDVEQPDTAQLLTTLTYSRVGEDCPALPITADLDGEELTVAPNASGRSGGACLLGFYLEAPTSSAAMASTISFHDDSGQASFSIQRLLAPRALVAGVAPDANLAAGNQVPFGWSVETDELRSADAYFKQGTQTIKGDARRAGNNVNVLVPELAKGGWAVELGALAAAEITACEQAAECAATIAGNGRFAFTIE